MKKKNSLCRLLCCQLCDDEKPPSMQRGKRYIESEALADGAKGRINCRCQGEKRAYNK